jgi:hypothetical protein
MRTGAIAPRRLLIPRALCVSLFAVFLFSPTLRAQTASAATLPGSPIAIVPIDAANRDEAAVVTGALEVTSGKAIIAASGSVTSGSRTTDVVLPRRGTLRVCASTTVKLAADTSLPASGAPGLLMAMDHGAVEMSFANTPDRNADVLMTPDFRILIGGPGASEVKVRLGRAGDTCVDNSGKDAPYVVVTSIFDGGLYRVQPGQRVMFQHGSLGEVVDEEKEPCGCPPPPEKTAGNDFPLAQSEGLAPLAPVTPVQNSAAPQALQVPALVYTGGQASAAATTPATPGQTAAPAAASSQPQSAEKKKPNALTRFGHFLRRIFGAE